MRIITGNFIMEGDEQYLRNATLDERRAALARMKQQQNVNARLLEVDYILPVTGITKGTSRPLTVLALMYLEAAPFGVTWWKYAERFGVTFTLNDKADREKRR